MSETIVKRLRDYGQAAKQLGNSAAASSFEAGAVVLEKALERVNQQETLRDRFAMAALTGLLASDRNWSDEGAALRAYKEADAMLQEREK